MTYAETISADFIALCELLKVPFTGVYEDVYNNAPSTKIKGTGIQHSYSSDGSWILINITPEFKKLMEMRGVEYYAPDQYGRMYL